MNKVYVTESRVQATPMTRQAYNDYRGWVLPSDECGTDTGYLINHLSTNHVNWLPEDVFLSQYTEETAGKTLSNTDIKGARKQVKDIEVFGNGDLFQLIAKASSASEKWMKSTKAMEITGVGCVIQVTTQQGDNVAEALSFVPGVRIEETIKDGVPQRTLVKT